eukprot:CAMPEP_0176002642 /NCGR_PEP_ID=MMETSP0120_2-20121206/754_1 /TAXON_ID=160619 /ORGANISM="Kryptoperidinium foliaceum, Strain CCMP 1326" /LENGTH=144 /DNA_ID=CAMNT_0017335241 /DNA_START=235 /DNA_END=669 /DNA_ORIENTATION=-
MRKSVKDEPITNEMPRGLLEKIGSTTSMTVAGMFYLVLAWKRDALMVSFFIGSISNGILSKILKKMLKQERPPDLDESAMEIRPSDNGMPSSHAMSLGFIGTFTAMQLPWTGFFFFMSCCHLFTEFKSSCTRLSKSLLAPLLVP